MPTEDQSTSAEPLVYADAPFAFHTRKSKLDWRGIAKLDLEQIEREVCTHTASLTRESGSRAPRHAYLTNVWERCSPGPPSCAQVDIGALEAHLETAAFARVSKEGESGGAVRTKLRAGTRRNPRGARARASPVKTALADSPRATI